MTLEDKHNHDNRQDNNNQIKLKTNLSGLVNTCNIFLNVNVDTHILMTISLLPCKLIKILLYRIISTLLYLSSDRKPRIYKTKNS